VRIGAPSDTAWYRVRTLLQTARMSGRADIRLVSADEVMGPLRTPPVWVPLCNHVEIARSAAPLIRLDLQHGPEGDWIMASARFQPLGEQGLLDTTDACWKGITCAEAWPAGPLRDACELGAREGAVERVTLGGPIGCAAPIAKPGTGDDWAQELTTNLKLWRLERADVLLSTEPAVSYGRFVEATLAIGRAGYGFPLLPEALIQGNEGPPVCDAEIRDAGALAVATARWYGAHANAD
jgi:hypothetical protein